MNEIKFKYSCKISEYPQSLINEIEKQYFFAPNNATFSTNKTVVDTIVWTKTTQGYDFWYDLYQGKDMSKYTEWLHLFEEVTSNNLPQYEIY